VYARPFRRSFTSVFFQGRIVERWRTSRAAVRAAGRVLMGYGEVVGNESVHWVVSHEDEQGGEVGLSSKPGKGHPKVGHDVHVEKGVRGCDPIRLSEVGRRKGHPGQYRVRLRFERQADAQAAAASVRVGTEDGMFVLMLDVPVIRRADPGDAPPAEIRIDW
jgi:hypothetical protein